MLPDYFVQTEYNTGKAEANKVKAILFCSYSIKVLSLSFVVLSSIFNMWYMFGFGALYAVGIVLRQWVLQRVEAYEYFFVRGRLKISVRNNFHKQKILADFPIDSIVGIEDVKDTDNEKTTVNAWLPNKSIIKIRFIENGITKTLYFSPSRYMFALIKKRHKDDLL